MKVLRMQAVTPYGNPVSGASNEEKKMPYGKAEELTEKLDKYAPMRKRHVLVDLFLQRTSGVREKLFGTESSVSKIQLNQVG